MNFAQVNVFFFLHIQFTLFQTKNLQSPGTYISGRTWDPSQRATTKYLIGNWMYEVRVNCASFLSGRHLLINKNDKNSRYTKHKNNDN